MSSDNYCIIHMPFTLRGLLAWSRLPGFCVASNWIWNWQKSKLKYL